MDNNELDRIIEGLSEFSGPNVNYELAWTEIKNIGESFKGVHYPTVDEKNLAWDRFQELVAQIKQSQNRYWETERFSETSEKIKGEILAKIISAKPPRSIEEAFGTTALKPLNIVSNVADATRTWPPIDDTRKILENCSKVLKNGWGLFKLYKNDMTGKDKHEIYTSLNRAQDILNLAWDKWRHIKKQSNKSKKQMWEKRKVEREKRNVEFQRKQNEWRNKIQEKISNLEQAIRSKENYIRKLESQIDVLR